MLWLNRIVLLKFNIEKVDEIRLFACGPGEKGKKMGERRNSKGVRAT